MRQPLIILAAVALGLSLAGCSSIDDLDPMGWFNTKKPLPGERKVVFPEGVPGVPQGVPPELVEGYQPPPEPPPQVAETPPEPPKKKPKPKPKKVASPAQPAPPARRPTAVTIQPGTQANQSAPQASQSPWPAPQQAAPQAASRPAPSPWPDPPPSR